MRMRLICLSAFASIVLVACTSTKDEASQKPTGVVELKPPVYAYELPYVEGEETRSVVVSGTHRTEVKGSAARFLPNGSVLIDTFPDEGDEGIEDSRSEVFDPVSGKSHSGGKLHNPENGSIGTGPDSMFSVHHDKSRAMSLREFALDFTLKREVDLPGESLIYGPLDDGASSGTTYGDPVGTPQAVFTERTEWSGAEATADMVIRVDKKNGVDTILRDKHIAFLTLSTDGRSVLAALNEDRPYFEGRPPTTSIVELDPETGAIGKSYGVPPPCKQFKPFADDASCLHRIDKVNGVVAAAVFESKDTDGFEFDGYSTWENRDGKWSEVKEQRGKAVIWQSRDDRLEQVLDLDRMHPKELPVEWFTGTKKRAQFQPSSFFDWHTWGSIIRP